MHRNVSLLAVFVLAAIAVRATPVVGPWVPKFKGIDFCVSSNLTDSVDFPNRHVVSALRVDLTDPDIRLLTTPRISEYVAGVREVGGLTVSTFLKTNHVQAAINAGFFDARDYYLPAGTPMDLYGLAISEGVVVSPQDGRGHAATITFDASNRATVIPTNWPATSVEGIYTAVSGNYPLVVAGRNIISRSARETEPRTVYGLSQDRRFLYLVAIDGRQPGYSEGANDYESAEWLLLLGAYDGVNMDGGGSTTLVIEDSTGAPIRLNHPSAVADSGRERTVGSHFGLFAKPLPGFINDVVAIPDDTTARITWTTVEPATAEVQYGTTAALGASSGVESALVTNHAVQLRGLTPGTGYYYRLLATTATQQFVSPDFYFVTTNYLTTNLIFAVTNAWKYTTANLDGLNWMSPSYDDSGWNGPGMGLLWVDVRATGPNPAIEPRNTEMPADAANGGFPFVSYYFRTHFSLTHLVAGSTLAFSGYVDDGAVFYLNGTEIHRLRIPDPAASDTLANAYPCDGDADCLDTFTLPATSIARLAVGDNLLAVEVHNYNRRSPDITFGASLSLLEPLMRTARLGIHLSGGSIALSWEGSGFVVQSASTLEGPWIDVAGATESPFSIEALPSGQFYRLRR